MKTKKLLIIPIIAGACMMSGPARSFPISDRPAESRSAAEIINYAPVTPREAGFDEDYTPDATMSDLMLKSLAPVTPPEAEFQDDNNLKTDISPVTPKEAGFDETI